MDEAERERAVAKIRRVGEGERACARLVIEFYLGGGEGECAVVTEIERDVASHGLAETV